MSTWPVQLQWVLNSDVATSINFLRSILRAAATDSVQGQALIACEETGANLAISQQTMGRVMRDMIPSPAPKIVKFANASVGFSPTDSAVTLSTSQAGVRFLGLAAALVTTIGPYNGARVLEFELKRTHLKLTEIPTVQHVEQLLEALKPRSERCNFTQLIVGYQMMVGGALRTRGNPKGCPIPPTIQVKERLDRLLLGVPSTEAIAGLIDVFRQLARIGDSSMTGATIKIGGSASWILAFTEWCLGAGASIYVEGDQEPIIQHNNPTFSLKIVILDGKDSHLEPIQAIIHQHQFEDITQLLGPIDKKPLRFMVDTENYADWLLHDLDFKRYGDLRHNTRMKEMLSEVLRHAVPRVLSLKCGTYGKLGQDKPCVRWAQSMHDPVEELAISPLPAMPAIGDACSKFLELRSTFSFSTRHVGFPICQLPSVDQYLMELEERCLCNSCGQNYPDLGLIKQVCLRKSFFRSVAFLILDILAFSLLDYHTRPRLFMSRARETWGMFKREKVEDGLSSFLEFGSYEANNDECAEETDELGSEGESVRVDEETIEVEDLLKWARSLVGHGDIEDEDRTLVMTSRRGQVTYPMIYETMRVEKYGYMQLCVLPGTIRCDGLVYDLVSCPEDVDTGKSYEHPILPGSLEVTQPQNLLSTFRMSWQAEAQANKQMHLYVLMQDSERQSFTVKKDPIFILQTLAHTLLLADCHHSPQATLARPDSFCRYVAPWHSHGEADASASNVDVVAIASSDDHRIFAMSCLIEACVLRKNACLSCCLKVCRRASAHVLIL